MGWCLPTAKDRSARFQLRAERSQIHNRTPSHSTPCPRLPGFQKRPATCARVRSATPCMVIFRSALVTGHFSSSQRLSPNTKEETRRFPTAGVEPRGAD